MSRVRSNQRVWLMDDFLDPDVVKHHDFSWIWNTSWDLSNIRKHTCHLNPTHPIDRFGALWIDFWVTYWAIQNLLVFFLHRIRLEDSFGQTIINFHKIGAEYGAIKGFGSWTFFFDPHVVKNHYFSQIWKTFLELQKHTPGLLEKHRSFASEAPCDSQSGSL